MNDRPTNVTKYSEKATTTIFIIFWDILMVDKIFLTPQIKRGVIISNKLVYKSCRTSRRMT